MAFDKPFVETMGFHDRSDNDDNSNDDDPDGLSDGLVGAAIHFALQAKRDFACADAVPRHIWHEYVLNYASLNEGRTSVRKLLRKRLVEPLFMNNNSDNNENRTIAETVRLINTHMWTLLASSSSSNDNNASSSIVFVAGQTPAIFDPTSVLAFGYASCTGLAILMVEALRAAGVPARVAGTAAWNGDRSKGNHNWVEVWTGHDYSGGHSSSSSRKNAQQDNDGKCRCDAATTTQDCQCGWSFLEPSPAQQTVDTLDRNPCERWFCRPERFAGTQTYAARLDNNQNNTNISFPLAWEWDNADVPAVNRTDYYQRVCAPCGGSSSGSSMANE